jgi:uncharacterized protein involved in exopolysaccharide biosynthesis
MIILAAAGCVMSRGDGEVIVTEDAPGRGVGASSPPVTPDRLPGRPPYDEPAAREHVNLLEFASVLLKRWHIVAGLPLFAALVTGAILLVLPRRFTATAVFVPEVPAPKLPSGLAGLAGQFGISLGAEATQSPRFYAEVVKSRELMERILLSRYASPPAKASFADSVTLLQVLRVRGRDASDSLRNGVRALENLISVRVDNQTNIVRLDVDAPYPELAAAVANRLVEYLNEFNAKHRESQAHERRRFVEQRIVDGERELRSGEEDLRTFYERNHSWQQSPQLVFEEGRLRRQVEIRQEVYLTLRREYETARIEEVNDTPVITVIDAAIPAPRDAKPKRLPLVGLALILGATLGVLVALGTEYVERMRREEDEHYRRFTGLLKGVRQEIRGAARLERKTIT